MSCEESSSLSSSASSWHYVFVYGTLKRDQPNNRYFVDKSNGSAIFIGKAECLEKRPLIIYSQYNIPFMLNIVNKGENVIGEVWKIDDKMLNWLDKFEEHPSYYERIEIKVRFVDNCHDDDHCINLSNIQQVWAYLLPKYSSEMLNCPFLKCYDSYGDHGLFYVESEETRSLHDI